MNNKLQIVNKLRENRKIILKTNFSRKNTESHYFPRTPKNNRLNSLY